SPLNSPEKQTNENIVAQDSNVLNEPPAAFARTNAEEFIATETRGLELKVNLQQSISWNVFCILASGHKTSSPKTDEKKKSIDISLNVLDKDGTDIDEHNTQWNSNPTDSSLYTIELKKGRLNILFVDFQFVTASGSFAYPT
ncbi:MAG: hypothetical protein EZS28_041444, partial [Streblomastix strix]